MTRIVRQHSWNMQEVAEHLVAVRPAIQELAALERQAQISFFEFKSRWVLPTSLKVASPNNL